MPDPVSPRFTLPRPVRQFGRGVMNGLAHSGYDAMDTVARAGNAILPGDPLEDVRTFAADGKQEATAFYAPEGTAGMAGQVAGGVAGHSAMMAAGGGLAMRGMQAAQRARQAQQTNRFLQALQQSTTPTRITDVNPITYLREIPTHTPVRAMAAPVPKPSPSATGTTAAAAGIMALLRSHLTPDD